jgi:hypothetical protein
VGHLHVAIRWLRGNDLHTQHRTQRAHSLPRSHLMQERLAQRRLCRPYTGSRSARGLCIRGAELRGSCPFYRELLPFASWQRLPGPAEERRVTTGSKIMFSLWFYLIFTTRVDPTLGSTFFKLILFEKSRLELEFVFLIFTTQPRQVGSRSLLPHI